MAATTQVSNASLHSVSESSAQIRESYLDLMKRCLTNTLHPERETRPVRAKFIRRHLLRFLTMPGWQVVEPYPFDKDKRVVGRDWPPTAETMIGLARLDHLQKCIEEVIHSQVPGDLIETGVWRGGATIFMRACLRAYGETERTVWVADSFEGLPKPDAEKYPADAGDMHYTYDPLRISIDDVKANFARYGLLDDRVRFLKGWFRDTLPTAPIEHIALLRLDGDMYESTIDALAALYSRVSIGGFIIVDDYGAVPGCKQAVHDFRDQHGIKDKIEPIDWAGAYWKRSG